MVCCDVVCVCVDWVGVVCMGGFILSGGMFEWCWFGVCGWIGII